MTSWNGTEISTVQFCLTDGTREDSKQINEVSLIAKLTYRNV